MRVRAIARLLRVSCVYHVMPYYACIMPVSHEALTYRVQEHDVPRVRVGVKEAHLQQLHKEGLLRRRHQLRQQRWLHVRQLLACEIEAKQVNNDANMNATPHT